MVMNDTNTNIAADIVDLSDALLDRVHGGRTYYLSENSRREWVKTAAAVLGSLGAQVADYCEPQIPASADESGYGSPEWQHAKKVTADAVLETPRHAPAAPEALARDVEDERLFCKRVLEVAGLPFTKVWVVASKSEVSFSAHGVEKKVKLRLPHRRYSNLIFFFEYCAARGVESAAAVLGMGLCGAYEEQHLLMHGGKSLCRVASATPPEFSSAAGDLRLVSCHADEWGEKITLLGVLGRLEEE